MPESNKQNDRVIFAYIAYQENILSGLDYKDAITKSAQDSAFSILDLIGKFRKYELINICKNCFREKNFLKNGLCNKCSKQDVDTEPDVEPIIKKREKKYFTEIELFEEVNRDYGMSEDEFLQYRSSYVFTAPNKSMKETLDES
jgi:hypothetical protein